MKTPRHKIAVYLAERTLAPSVDVRKLSREVAAYLLETGRTGELGSLLRDIQDLRADKGVVEVKAVTAHPLSDAARTDIQKQVKQLYPDAKRVIVSEAIDPDLIGGVRLELAHQQLDLSIRGKLNRFKQRTAVNGAS